VRGQHLANLLTYAHGGMERQRWLLKDQSDSAAADLTEFLGIGLEKILSLKKDGAASDVAIRRKKPQDRRRERAFARAGLAENAQNFSGHQAETYA